MELSLLNIGLVLIGAATLLYGVFMLLFVAGLKRLKRNRRVDFSDWPSVSVIVPARNEASVLPWALNSLMRQRYAGDWEVVVVDDRSSDETPKVLRELCEKYANLRVVRIDESKGASPKKYALSVGIASSSKDIVVTTDADCQYSVEWLSGMISHMTDDVGVVAGLTIFDLPNFKAAPAWQKIQWLDFFVQNFLAAGALGFNHAASCNGSNLCFRRIVYDQISGYGQSAQVVSGDDVLFAQRVAAHTKWRMVFATAQETIVKSLPVATVGELMHQRLRWASKGLTYRGSMLGFLFAIYGYYCSLIALPIAALFMPSLILPTALIWGSKLAVDSVLIMTGVRTFSQERLLPYFPAYEVLHTVFTPFFGFAGLILPYHWKGGWYRTAKLPWTTRVRWLRRGPAKIQVTKSDGELIEQ
jgi:cellulose synthase/poly-beta-1,6-N-acetylglucosamine synthase-like glycosyltransferase